MTTLEAAPRSASSTFRRRAALFAIHEGYFGAAGPPRLPEGRGVHAASSGCVAARSFTRRSRRRSASASFRAAARSGLCGPSGRWRRSVFYGENSNGVGGHVKDATQAAHMVGASAMGPQPFEVKPKEGETQEEARERILERFEKIGLQELHEGGTFGENLHRLRVLGDRDKRAIVGQLVGQAYVAGAHNLVLANREAVEHIADVLSQPGASSSATSSSSSSTARS